MGKLRLPPVKALKVFNGTGLTFKKKKSKKGSWELKEEKRETGKTKKEELKCRMSPSKLGLDSLDSFLVVGGGVLQGGGKKDWGEKVAYPNRDRHSRMKRGEKKVVDLGGLIAAETLVNSKRGAPREGKKGFFEEIEPGRT